MGPARSRVAVLACISFLLIMLSACGGKTVTEGESSSPSASASTSPSASPTADAVATLCADLDQTAKVLGSSDFQAIKVELGQLLPALKNDAALLADEGKDELRFATDDLVAALGQVKQDIQQDGLSMFTSVTLDLKSAGRAIKRMTQAGLTCP